MNDTPAAWFHKLDESTYQVLGVAPKSAMTGRYLVGDEREKWFAVNGVFRRENGERSE